MRLPSSSLTASAKRGLALAYPSASPTANSNGTCATPPGSWHDAQCSETIGSTSRYHVGLSALEALPHAGSPAAQAVSEKVSPTRERHDISSRIREIPGFVARVPVAVARIVDDAHRGCHFRLGRHALRICGHRALRHVEARRPAPGARHGA